MNKQAKTTQVYSC